MSSSLYPLSSQYKWRLQYQNPNNEPFVHHHYPRSRECVHYQNPSKRRCVQYQHTNNLLFVHYQHPNDGTYIYHRTINRQYVHTNGSCVRYQYSIYEPCVILVTDYASFITKNLKMNGTAIISTLLPDLQTHAYINDKRSVFASEGGGGDMKRHSDRLDSKN